MSITPHRRAVVTVVALGLTLAACGGAAPETTTAPTHAAASDADLVALAVKVSELERRIDALEGGGEGEHAGESSTDATDEHATDEHATDEHATGDATGEHTTGDATDEHATDEHATGTDETATDAHGTAAPAAHGDAPHWGYADADHWGELAEEFLMCDAGMEQSPIDLTQAQMTSIPDATLAYTPAAATVTDNGHTVQVNLTGAGTATVDGHEYELVQFHFHAPSEHTVDGVHSPVEAHFVHKDAEGNLAVIGVMIVEGEAHPMFDAVIEAIPGKNEEVPLGEPVDARSLMPEALMAYRYPGSLTTPPCTEGVTWSVLQQPITWSAEQVSTLAAHFAEANNRPVQPLNYRELELDVVAG